MTNPRKVFAVLVMLSLSVLILPVRAGGRGLEGVWAVQELTTEKPMAKLNKPTGLLVISGRHFSLSLIANSERPNFGEGGVEEATADELRAIWGPMLINAGTFTITGDTIRITRTLAKHPKFMAPGNFVDLVFERKGDTLTMTDVRNNFGPVQNPGTMRMTRVK
jgi:hypothetical protein